MLPVKNYSEDFMDVKDAMVEAGFDPEMAEVTMKASTSVDLGVDDAQKVMRMVDMLEDLSNIGSDPSFS